ncbi:hypothetical protein [Hydrogenibacillus sp. N12]|uniref:hypothetical protein n=1 Tax=Hydrogenibacillus sp. N12 TaxID=2866627 RepID=UPI001C7D096E|nr:hypothetical protein [Hydrogenibacillus sp. N12]QZA33034.1 hypothetical protein K2M58_00050 [Hydrogenibacillus sp. N12]
MAGRRERDRLSARKTGDAGGIDMVAVGVLALAGAFGTAAARLLAAGASVRLIRRPEALSDVGALVIPSAEPHLLRVMLEREWPAMLERYWASGGRLWAMGPSTLLFVSGGKAASSDSIGAAAGGSSGHAPIGASGGGTVPPLWRHFPLAARPEPLRSPADRSACFLVRLSLPGVAEDYLAPFLRAPAFPAEAYRDDAGKLRRIGKWGEHIVFLDWDGFWLTAFSPEWADDPAPFLAFVRELEAGARIG